MVSKLLNLFLFSQPIYGNDDLLLIYTSQDENSYSVVVHWAELTIWAFWWETNTISDLKVEVGWCFQVGGTCQPKLGCVVVVLVWELNWKIKGLNPYSNASQGRVSTVVRAARNSSNCYQYFGRGHATPNCLWFQKLYLSFFLLTSIWQWWYLLFVYTLQDENRYFVVVLHLSLLVGNN